MIINGYGYKEIVQSDINLDPLNQRIKELEKEILDLQADVLEVNF